MMGDLLGAAVKAVQEAMLTEAATAARATPIDEAEVAALVATLPEKARAGKTGDPGATSFLFHEWEPRNRRAAEIAGAARDRLAALGLVVAVENVRVGLREIPGRLSIDYQDLEAAARAEEAMRADWVSRARELWATVGGEGADVRELVARSGSVVARFSTRGLAVPRNDATPFRLDFLLRARERELEVEGFWRRSVKEVVASVDDTLRPVRWTIPDIEAAWQRVGGLVTFSYGMFTDHGLRQCTVLELRRGSSAHKIAVEDVRTLTVDEIVALAEREGPWARGETAAPPLAQPDPVDPRVVAGAARDQAVGLGPPDQRDVFRYVAPPGPRRVHVGDTVPVEEMVDGAPAKDPGILPPTEQPTQHPDSSGLLLDGSGVGRPEPEAAAPGKGRHRKAVSAP